MFYIYTLAALACAAALIFAVPLRAKNGATLAVVLAGAVPAVVAAAGVLSAGTPRRLWNCAGGLPGSDGGSMDGLSALFVLLIAIGSVGATLYARGYLARTLHRKSPVHVSLHYTALATICYAMLGVVCSDGGYSFLFCWELMTAASFVLILYDAERREVLRAALSYLIMMHVGFALLVAGFARLGAATGSASFAALTTYAHTQPLQPLALVFLLGFGMKAGMFPMHVWLPEAHPAAPSHVSALMSGVMIKTGIYGILRVAGGIDSEELLRTTGLLLLAAGAVTGLWGAILAAVQNDVKRILAYSSIENVGIVVLGIGVAALGKSTGNGTMALWGLAGALLHTLNHSLFKTLLFFGAGNVASQTRTASLDALGGLGKRMPATATLFLTAAAAICALPPLNGFVSELLVYRGLFEGIASGSDPLAAAAGIGALALIGGIVLLAFAKLCGTVFLGRPRTRCAAEATEVDRTRLAAAALPLAGMLFIGLFPTSAAMLAVRAASFFVRIPPDAADRLVPAMLGPAGRTAWLLAAVAGLLVRLRGRTLARRTTISDPAWSCGFTATDARMQYTGESFSEGLESLAAPLTQNRIDGRAVDKSELFPAAHDFDIRRKDRIDRLLSAWWVELLRQINRRAMRLRTGKIDRYLLFALAFPVLVLLLSLLELL